MARKILFYGDSNTYGYDPANWQTFRYPCEQRWTSILAEKLGEEWSLIPEGMNGRQIPDLLYDRKWLTDILRPLKAGDVFAVMLGTNDILLTTVPDADEAVGRMRVFLQFVKERLPDTEILLIAPPPAGKEEIRDPLYAAYYRECLRMNAGFRDLAEQLQVHFTDAGEWGISLSSDLVHFSEAGHRQFAAGMAEIIGKVL